VDKQDWRDSLAENVELLGHRNWILIADSAYPSPIKDRLLRIIFKRI
jgi:hypothetical protein